MRLDGVSLCYEINKPFDIVVKGLSVPSDRGDSPLTILNETAEYRVVRILLPAVTHFTGDAINQFVLRGKYENRRAKAKRVKLGK